MLWHVVRFRFPADVDEAERAACEAALAEMPDAIAHLRTAVVGRDLDDPLVTGLVTTLDEDGDPAAALATYRDHPAHTPVAARLRAIAEHVTRFDVVAG